MRAASAEKPITVGRVKSELRKAERGSGTGGTGATILKMAASPVQKLVESGAIGPVELQAATDIERAFMALSGGLLLKPQTLERVDGSRRPDWSSHTAAAVERYRVWADHWSIMAKRGAPCLAITIALAIDQRSFAAVDVDFGIREGRSKKVLGAMLRDYAARAGWCDASLGGRWTDEAERLFRTDHPNLRLARIAAQSTGSE